MDTLRNFRRLSGQSILFMAVLIVILIAALGFAIDTSDAFQRQRTIQAAANAGAVSGMNYVVLNQLDPQIQTTIRETMTQNGVSGENIQQVYGSSTGAVNWGTGEDVVYFRAEYLDEQGQYINDVGRLANNTAPSTIGAAFVRVTTREGVSTTFAKVFNQDRFTVSAEGAAGLSECTQSVMPLTFDQSEINDVQTLPFRYWDAEIGTIRSSFSSTVFKVVKKSSPGNFLWLRWRANDNGANALNTSWTGTGDLSSGFDEATPPSSHSDYQEALAQMNHRLEIGDWMHPKPGNVAAQQSLINWHITNKSQIILPLHDALDGNGNNRTYHASRFVRVRILQYVPNGGSGYFEFSLLSPFAMCSGIVPPTPPGGNDEYPMTVKVDEVLSWHTPPEEPKDMDIVLVTDTSFSMRFCWATNNPCGAGQRRIDSSRDFTEDFVHEMLVVRKQSGSNNRVAMVTYGRKINGRVTAEMLVDFTTEPEPFSQAFNQIAASSNAYLSGNTPTAAGLNQGYALINAKARPNTDLVVLLVTDGLSNVIFDAPYEGHPNNHNRPPFFCGDKATDMDNPLVQSTCPRGPSHGEPRSPIQASIDIASDARQRNPDMRTYAVALAQPEGLSVQDLRLDKIAQYTFMANNPEALQSIVTALSNELAEPCREKDDPLTPAIGADISLVSEAGANMGTFKVGADGTLTTMLQPGTYKMRVQHLNVVSPNDPLEKPRNYTRIYTAASPEPSSEITFEMPAEPFVHPDVTLVIDNEANAACPAQ